MNKASAIVAVVSFLFSISAYFFALWVWNARAIPSLNSDALPLAILEIMLGVLSIMLGIGAIAGYWMVKGAAEQAARNTARETAQEEIRKMKAEGLLDVRGGNDNIPDVVVPTTPATSGNTKRED